MNTKMLEAAICEVARSEAKKINQKHGRTCEDDLRNFASSEKMTNMPYFSLTIWKVIPPLSETMGIEFAIW